MVTDFVSLGCSLVPCIPTLYCWNALKCVSHAVWWHGYRLCTADAFKHAILVAWIPILYCWDALNCACMQSGGMDTDFVQRTPSEEERRRLALQTAPGGRESPSRAAGSAYGIQSETYPPLVRRAGSEQSHIESLVLRADQLKCQVLGWSASKYFGWSQFKGTCLVLPACPHQSCCHVTPTQGHNPVQ